MRSRERVAILAEQAFDIGVLIDVDVTELQGRDVNLLAQSRVHALREGADFTERIVVLAHPRVSDRSRLDLFRISSLDDLDVVDCVFVQQIL